MQKCICDICEKNIADRKYKIKQEKELAHFEYGFAFPRTEWVEIDTCENCYRKLVDAGKHRKTSDRVLDNVFKSYDSYKDDSNRQEAYLAGAIAAIEAIDPKIFLDKRWNEMWKEQ